MTSKLTRVRGGLTRVVYLLFAAVTLATCCRTMVFADCPAGVPDTDPPSCISRADLDAINEVPGQDPMYDPSGNCDASDANSVSIDSGGSVSSGSGVWNSNLQPPYILEQFMIQLLENIAAKRKVPVADTVTLPHVEALVTFAYGEGGGITNNDFWNPFNTGYGDPALLATAHSTSGVQAFKNFDDGVEANARIMSGWTTGVVATHQTRLGDVLTKQGSTVADFFHALTYYKETPGNLEWATTSLNDPSAYYNNYISLSAQTINNWTKTAALIMRSKDSDSKTLADSSKLAFHPGAGQTTADTYATGSSTDAANCCENGVPVTTGDTPATSNTTGGVNNVIVLDPGHIEQSHEVTDQTGLIDDDYPNHPELEDVWDVAQLVSAQLGKDGYDVKMTKDNVQGTNASGGYISLRDRANVAIDDKAALAVSIHDDASQNFTDANNIVYAQAAGQYRQTPAGKKVLIAADATTISASQTAAHDIATARAAAEGHTVRYTTDATNDIGTRLPSPGSIWMVQLFSTVPWVYDEAGGKSAGQTGLSAGDKQKYANGLIKGIEAAVPLKGAGAGTIANSSASAAACDTPVDGVSGSAAKIVAEAKLLAWPQGDHGEFKDSAKPEYQDVEPKIDGYTSNSATDPAFSDCGVFVATVLRASGVDPKYQSRGTSEQRSYLESHPSMYKRVLVNGQDPTNTAKLEPGDILVTTSGEGHTYLYMGTWGDGNKYNSASGSYFQHVPQAGRFYQAAVGHGQHFEVFRVAN